MSAVVDAPPSRRIKELEVMVADVVVETPDTSTLVFFTGNDHQWDRDVARALGEEPAPRFLESVLADLKSLGVPNARIKRESYG